MWILWSIGGNDLHLIFMWESEQINFLSFHRNHVHACYIKQVFDENIELLVKILAVIFINK